MAAFILGREDTTVARSKKSQSPRDNVIYEAGLFTGRIGMSNVFLIVDQNGTKMPTDLKGVTYTTYNSKKHDTDEAVRLAAIEIRNEIKSWSKRQEQNLENQVCGHWFQYVLNNDDGAVVSLMNIYRDKDQSTICLEGVINFRRVSSQRSLTSELRMLHNAGLPRSLAIVHSLLPIGETVIPNRSFVPRPSDAATGQSHFSLSGV